MIDIKLIRENPEKIKAAIKAKQRVADIDLILEIDERYRKNSKKAEELRHQRKNIARDDIAQAKSLKEELKALEDLVAIDSKKLTELLMQVPNPPAESVKIGTEEDNEVIETQGEIPQFDFPVKDHVELGLALNILDFERASKISGSRFVIVKNDLALLELSLVRFVVDKLRGKGFDFVLPPALINRIAMQGMGYLEHGGDQETYYLPNDDMFLIGTSEHALGAMRMGEIFHASELPHRISGFSPSFRREAGSYGKDTKGMLRVHQFDKVEMFSYTLPEQSDSEFKNLLDIAKEIVSDLELPFQVVAIASGDLGDPASAKFDIETWLPAQNKYRETHSISTTTDFQSRRLNIRYKSDQGDTGLVYTLNGTAVAVGRTLIAIMENYQQADGSIKIPAVLVPYMGKEVINVNSN